MNVIHQCNQATATTKLQGDQCDKACTQMIITLSKLGFYDFLCCKTNIYKIIYLFIFDRGPDPVPQDYTQMLLRAPSSWKKNYA